jgi:hypothetical protein
MATPRQATKRIKAFKNVTNNDHFSMKQYGAVRENLKNFNHKLIIHLFARIQKSKPPYYKNQRD